MSHARIARIAAVVLLGTAVVGAVAGPMSIAHAASLREPASQVAATTYVDPTQSYTLSYPIDWSRSQRKNFDLFVLSPDQNVFVGAASSATAGPSAGHLERDLPTLVKALGTPLGQPTYSTYHPHGATLHVGMSGYTSASGKVGVVVLEEGRARHRLCMVAGVVLNAGAATAKQDIAAAVTILTSLQLQPNPLDAPSG